MKLINLKQDRDVLFWTPYVPLQISKIMPTKFSDFMSEIEKEAIAEGRKAVQELQDLRRHFKEERCLVEEFFRHQQELPASRRTDHCMISCPCSRCSPGRL